MGEEFLDVVTEEDEVLYSAPISEIYAKKHLHRLVHVFIFNSKGELALQLRSGTKSFCPLHWTETAGGHVQSGESYIAAALRELKEETGITGNLEYVGKELFTDTTTHQKGLRKFFQIYKCVTDEANFEIDPEEVERVEHFSLEVIRRMLSEGEKFHPECRFILEKYFL